MVSNIRVLVLGATGMLGHALFAGLWANPEVTAFGTVRSFGNGATRFSDAQRASLLGDVHGERPETIEAAIREVRPDTVINCIGLIKQLPESRDPERAVRINALLPHVLTRLTGDHGARLIHISTDCVFNGKKGGYRESDPANAEDLYGRSKFLGEVSAPHAVTLRTSMIGHELQGRISLIEWFLSQRDSVRGYAKAIFTGLPTVELSRVVQRHVLGNRKLAGLYHVSAAPISKYELLRLVGRIYDKRIEIVPDEQVQEDRSLDGSRFAEATGYIPPSWSELVRAMHEHYIQSPFYDKGDHADAARK